MKTLISSLVLAAFAVVLAPSQADADHEETFAKECVQHVNQIVRRCLNAAVDETKECVRKINALQEQGREEAARQVARRCIENATERTEHCVRAVREICEECIEVLLYLGEPELARRVHNVCVEAVEDLRHILQREKNAILTALEN